ncbi:MAG: type II toxin-antitoxin system prevent-host-death family antitoxin [Microlunatus sp.]
MRTITATEASRRFSDLLDAIERGEEVTITRGNRPVAQLRPVRHTGRELEAALATIPPPDGRFYEDIADTLSLLEPAMRDPWNET